MHNGCDIVNKFILSILYIYKMCKDYNAMATTKRHVAYDLSRAMLPAVLVFSCIMDYVRWGETALEISRARAILQLSNTLC